MESTIPEITYSSLASLEGLPINSNYGAFFSSVYGGITIDSRLMLLPIDDHMVHRGDGVFEAIKIANDRPYLFNQHMRRLQRSAGRLDLQLYNSLEKMSEIALETWQRAKPVLQTNMALMRIFLSRGPGNFGVNPYDTRGSQFYVVITRLSELPKSKYESGVKVGRASLIAKPSWLAQVKSCNYLPNVMLKKEAVDRNLDFTIGLDINGFVSESATENIIVLTADGHLVRPKGDFILEGCTMQRVFDLAGQLIVTKKAKDFGLDKIETRNLLEAELFTAKEIFMTGTTLDVLPVTEYEGQPIAKRQVGPLGKELLRLIQQDQQ